MHIGRERVRGQREREGDSVRDRERVRDRGERIEKGRDRETRLKRNSQKLLNHVPIQCVDPLGDGYESL